MYLVADMLNGVLGVAASFPFSGLGFLGEKAGDGDLSECGN